MKNKYGSTTLHLAAWKGHTEVVKLLISHSAQVNAIKNKYGQTPIYTAAYWGHPKVVAVLLCHSAGVDAETCGEKTALQLAEEMGQDDIVDLLRQPIKISPFWELLLFLLL